MKYCPYCGAEILSGAFSFCPSCGESLPVLAQPAAEKAPGKPSPQREKAKQLILSEVEALDCDGYYEDVQPIDADRQREGVDTRLILRVVLLVAGVALVIGGCVAALFLL